MLYWLSSRCGNSPRQNVMGTDFRMCLNYSDPEFMIIFAIIMNSWNLEIGSITFCLNRGNGGSQWEVDFRSPENENLVLRFFDRWHNDNYARDFRISEIRVWRYSWWGEVGRSGCELATKSIWSQRSTTGTPLQNRSGTPTLIISGDLVHLRCSEFSDLKVNI